MTRPKRRLLIATGIIAIALLALHQLRIPAAQYLIDQQLPTAPADAAVVLNGPNKIDRLSRAAALYHQGLAKKIIINGDRRSPAASALYNDGFQRSAPWDSYRRDILHHLGIPDQDIIALSLPQAYDSISEAQAHNNALQTLGYKSLIITTSSSHSRRAHAIWQRLYGQQLTIYSAPTQNGDFDPNNWWKSPRQAREFLWEWGAYLYLQFQTPTAASTPP